MPLIIVKTEEEILSTYELMKQLRPHLEKETFFFQIKELQQKYNYTLIALIENGLAKAAAGYRISHSLAWGKFLYVDDLITDENSRKQGYARQLFDFLDEEVKRNDCDAMHLDSGVQRHDAHRFYLNRKMRISSHHFQRSYK